LFAYIIEAVPKYLLRC